MPLQRSDCHEAVRREYDQLAEEYDQRWRSYIDATLEAVLEVIPLEGRERLLDVPCGTGELEPRLLARRPELQITGVDLSPEMLRRAQPKDADRRVSWVAADVLHLPFANEQFDCVVCANSFHYFASPQGSLAELRRVLRPGGSLVLLDWCDDYLSCKICSLWLRWTDPAVHRVYSLRGCRTLLEEAGFQVMAADRFRISWLWGLMRFVCRRETQQGENAILSV